RAQRLELVELAPLEHLPDAVFAVAQREHLAFGVVRGEHGPAAGAIHRALVTQALEQPRPLVLATCGLEQQLVARDRDGALARLGVKVGEHLAAIEAENAVEGGRSPTQSALGVDDLALVTPDAAALP